MQKSNRQKHQEKKTIWKKRKEHIEGNGQETRVMRRLMINLAQHLWMQDFAARMLNEAACTALFQDLVECRHKTNKKDSDFCFRSKPRASWLRTVAVQKKAVKFTIHMKKQDDMQAALSR